MRGAFYSTIMVLALAIAVNPAHAQSTAFSYQGALSDGGGPANGLFDMTFGLFASEADGAAVSTVTDTSIFVTNGLFTTTLDFGPSVFDGTDYWLEIGVQPDGGGGFTTLEPRQPLNAVPYAIHAIIAETVPSLNNLGIGGWLNTIDTSLIPTSTSSTISGGAFNLIVEDLTVVPPEYVFWSDYSTISGGTGNTITNSSFATIGGGGADPLEETSQSIDNASGATIAGGVENHIRFHAGSATISGGGGNEIGTNSFLATISGGSQNTMGMGADSATIGGGRLNHIGQGAVFSNEFETYYSMSATIGGGESNVLSDRAIYSVICGGLANTIQTNAENATISGGTQNTIGTDAENATIGGGGQNTIGIGGQWFGGFGSASTIAGGEDNRIGDESFATTISGGSSNTIDANAWWSTIGGGIGNVIQTAQGATIGGGGTWAGKFGVFANTIERWADGATIGGGHANTIGTYARSSTIGGGIRNEITMDSGDSTIAGGRQNTILTNSIWATIGGGVENSILADADSATVPGGRGNSAGGAYSFAAGRRAKALHEGSFVWADSSELDIFPWRGFQFSSTATNEFAIRATGGVRFVTGIDTNGAPTAGVQVLAGGTGWDVISDRNMKENFEAVDGKQVLEQVAAMPISRWNMKSQDPSIRHIGPMAQDFYAAFGLGESDRLINTVDADGVALAAIQGLNQKLEEQQVALGKKDSEIESLKQSVAELKEMMTELNQLLTERNDL